MKGRNIVLGIIIGILAIVVVGGIGYGLYRIGYARGYAVGLAENVDVENLIPHTRGFTIPFAGKGDLGFGFNRMNMIPGRTAFGRSPIFGLMGFVGFTALVGGVLYLIFRRNRVEVVRITESPEVKDE